jgi:hypothetical protein
MVIAINDAHINSKYGGVIIGGVRGGFFGKIKALFSKKGVVFRK